LLDDIQDKTIYHAGIVKKQDIDGANVNEKGKSHVMHVARKFMSDGNAGK